MKLIIILIYFSILAVSMAMIISSHNPVAMNSPAPSHTLSQDLDEIARMNDEQFQAFVPLISSSDANLIKIHFRSQPQVIALKNWIRQDIMLSRGELQLHESEKYLIIFIQFDFWFNSIYGWQDIANELFLYYPENMLRSHVQMKTAQDGIFPQFFQRLQTLKPVYDSITALPAAQRLAAALEAKGINITAIDTFIRNQFGWQRSRIAVDEQNSTAAFANISETTQAPASSPAPIA